MFRTITVVAFLVVLVVVYFWIQEQSGKVPTTAPFATEASNPVFVAEAQLGSSTPNAQETATADILLANNRATSSAATTTQNAVQTQFGLQQTQVMLQQTQMQLSLQLTADWAAVNAGATTTQQYYNDSAAGTAIAIAAVVSAQTQSAVATQQMHADQMRASEIQTQDMITLLWTGGPLLLLLAVVAVGVWAIWYWDLFTRFGISPGSEPKAPVITQPSPPHQNAHSPQAKSVIDQHVPIEPGSQISGWMDEVKEELRASQEEDDVTPAT